MRAPFAISVSGQTELFINPRTGGKVFNTAPTSMEHFAAGDRCVLGRGDVVPRPVKAAIIWTLLRMKRRAYLRALGAHWRVHTVPFLFFTVLLLLPMSTCPP